MSRSARDLMQVEVRSVPPDLAVTELDKAFVDAGVGGFPVVEDGRLVGIVSRSDVVRQLYVELALSEYVSDFYRDVDGSTPDGLESLEAMGRRAGSRVAGMRVADVMMHRLITVTPDQPIAEVARVLVDHHIHRLPVVEDGRLVGILTSLDLVRLLAEGRV